MHFTMKLNWAVPKKHVYLIHLRGNHRADIEFQGHFLYESGESIEIDAAIACCIKNFVGGDATHPDKVLYCPTQNYSIQISGDEILDHYGRDSLKSLVLEQWIDDRYDYERAAEMLSGDMTISEFLK